MMEELKLGYAEFKKLSNSERLTLLDWCSQITKIKTISNKWTSYGLKHVFERSKNGFYITNDAFIYAMYKLDFKLKRCYYCSPNFCFNISLKSLKELVRETGSEQDKKSFGIKEKYDWR